MLADPEQNWFICFPVVVSALYSESPSQGRMRERSLFLSTVITLNRWRQHSHIMRIAPLSMYLRAQATGLSLENHKLWNSFSPGWSAQSRKGSCISGVTLGS